MPIAPPGPGSGGGVSPPSSGGANSAPSFSQVNGPYWLLLTQSGITFTSGISADWSLLFTAPETTSVIATLNGELEVGDLTTGLMASIAVMSLNPWTNAGLWVEASVGAATQIKCNDTVQEITASALVSIDMIAGVNVIHVTRAAGPVIVKGVIFNGRQDSWSSLYPPGGDPFLSDSNSSPVLGSINVGAA